MGSDRNFITSLMAELTPRSFGPSLEGRFAKQMSGVSKRQEDKETCLMLESACLLTRAGCTIDQGPRSVTKAIYSVHVSYSSSQVQ